MARPHPRCCQSVARAVPIRQSRPAGDRSPRCLRSFSNRLELEITESVLLQDNDATLTTLHQLRSMGIRIALDDFGTGYSSLSYLRRFPFDKIKVDQLFVRDLPDEGDAAVIVKSIVRLGASLRMITTAEGVETEEQLVRLRAAGCTQAQGFFFAKPKPAQELSYSLKGCPALERAA